MQAESVVTISGTVTAAASCRVEVTSAQTISIGLGVWSYDLEATLTSGYTATLQQGTITVRRDVR
jgi:type 1 fimbria pilin